MAGTQPRGRGRPQAWKPGRGRRLYTFDLAQEWIRDGVYKVEGFVTHHFKLDQYKDAFRLAMQNSPEVIKTFSTVNDETG